MHSKRHSKSCTKGNKKCRFHFPRPPSNVTFITQPKLHNDQEKDEANQKLKKLWDILDHPTDTPESFDQILNILGITFQEYMDCHNILSQRNTVVYKRHPDDAWINPYNSVLLQSWDANIDIQPVLDARSCIMYIVSYISKTERELGDLLKQVQTEMHQTDLQPLQQLRQLGNVFISNREVSVMEAIYRITGMRLKHSSRQTIYLPSDPLTAR